MEQSIHEVVLVLVGLDQLVVGANVLIATATSHCGKTASATITAYWDNDLPAVVVRDAAAGGRLWPWNVVQGSTAAVRPTVEVTDSSPTSFEVLLDGQPYDGTDVTAPGRHELLVNAGDLVHQVSYSWTFYIDQTAPSVAIECPKYARWPFYPARCQAIVADTLYAAGELVPSLICDGSPCWGWDGVVGDGPHTIQAIGRITQATAPAPPRRSFSTTHRRISSSRHQEPRTRRRAGRSLLREPSAT